MLNKKRDIFDEAGDFLLYPAAIVSGIFSGKLLAGMFGFEFMDARIIVLITAVLVTVGEIKLFRTWEKTGNYKALLLGLLVSLLSIAGSLGYFHMNLQENILASDEYLNQKAIVDTWREKTDEKKYPATYLWNTTKFEKANEKLNEVRAKGAGVGAAPYIAIREATGWSLEKSALIANLLVAIIIELLLVWGVVNRDEPENASEIEPKSNTKSFGFPVYITGGKSPVGFVAPGTVNATGANGDQPILFGKLTPSEQSNSGKSPSDEPDKAKPYKVGFHGGTANPGNKPDSTPPLLHNQNGEKEVVVVDNTLKLEGGLNDARVQAMNERREIVRGMLSKASQPYNITTLAAEAGMSKNTFRKYMLEILEGKQQTQDVISDLYRQE